MFMEELFNKCELCPRKCKVNRNNNELGFCRASNVMRIGGYHLHMWEEPVITGNRGSGTIFFSFCNLKCVYCQNYDISFKNIGEDVSVERLSEIMIELQDMNALNINLVTPGHYIPLIRDSILMAKNKGLNIPIIYNTSGYESVNALKLLDGLIDIYLPDFKYFNNEIAVKYSKAYNYKEICIKALEEMTRQVSKCKFKNNLLKKGVIVRHLMLPNMENDTKEILNYLYNTYKDNIYISLMNQYTPIKKLKYNELNNTLDEKIYENMIDYAYNLGIRNCFVQEQDSKGKCFIPDFTQKIES